MLEILKFPLVVLYIGCLVFITELKRKEQRRSLMFCAMFMGVLISL